MPSQREGLIREVAIFRKITEDAGIECYATVIEIVGHVFERPIEVDTHTLQNSCGVCEDERPPVRNAWVIVVNDIAEKPIVKPIG